MVPDLPERAIDTGTLGQVAASTLAALLVVGVLSLTWLMSFVPRADTASG